MTAQHTPGPWRWFANERTGKVYLATPDRGRLIVMDFEQVEMGDGDAVCVPRFARWAGFRAGAPREDWGGVMVPATNWGRNEGDHNGAFDLAALHPDARLIAAAPDLLAACVRMKDFLDAGAAAMEPRAKAGDHSAANMLSVILARREVVEATIAKAMGASP